MFDTRRSEIEIIEDILKLSVDGAKKTEILYQGNLSYTLLRNYLGMLLETKVLEERSIQNNGNGSSKLYVTTEKGHELLKDINKMMSHFRQM